MQKSKRQNIIEMAEQGIVKAKESMLRELERDPEQKIRLKTDMLTEAIDIFRKIIEKVKNNHLLSDELKAVTANLSAAVEGKADEEGDKLVLAAHIREGMIEALAKLSQL